jgi:hypothetical protein
VLKFGYVYFAVKRLVAHASPPRIKFLASSVSRGWLKPNFTVTGHLGHHPYEEV